MIERLLLGRAPTVRFGSSLCENSTILPNAQTSTAQIALYSILSIRVIVEDLPNGIAIWVFTRPYMDTARFAKQILM